MLSSFAREPFTLLVACATGAVLQRGNLSSLNSPPLGYITPSPHFGLCHGVFVVRVTLDGACRTITVCVVTVQTEPSEL